MIASSATPYDPQSRRSSVASFISEVEADQPHAKLCVVCGLHFRKGQIAVHQRLCIRSSVPSSRRQSSVTLSQQQQQQQHYGGMAGFVDDRQQFDESASPEMMALAQPQYFPCANCRQQVLQEKLGAHMKMCNGSRVPRPTTTQKVAQTAMTVQQQQQYVHKSLPEVPAMTMDDEYEPQVAAPEHPVYLKPKKIVQKRAVVAPVAVPSPEPVYDEDFEQEEEDEEEDEYEEEVPSRVANNAAPAGNPLYQEVQDRTPCNICGRKFSQDALQRHIPACTKLNTKKRAVYDSLKFRVQGTPIAQFLKQQQASKAIDDAGLPPKKSGKKGKKVRATVDQHEEQVIPTLDVNSSDKTGSNWQTTHEQLVRNVRMSKQSSGATHAGRVRRGVPAAVEVEMIACPHCTRNFNENAAERHIPICKATMDKSKLHPSPATKLPAEKVDALKRRTAYQPPLPKTPSKAAQSVSSPAVAKKPVVAMAAACCSGCGGTFATAKAKFCFECGTKR